MSINYKATVLVGAEPEGTYRVPDASATPKTLYGPRGVYCNGSVLIVADTGNHRVLIWNEPLPIGNRRGADIVLGQPDMYSDSPNAGGHPEKGLFMPTGVFVDERGRLWVADAWNHRILMWERIPDTSYQEPDHVIGQPDKFSTEKNLLFWCFGVFFSEGKGLFVCDTGNKRVLWWKNVPDSLEKPDGVYEGYSWPHTICEAEGLIYVADAGTGVSKVFIYKDSLDNRVGIWGAREGCCRECLNLPYGVSAGQNYVAVADTSNNRVLLFRRRENQPFAVLGQENFDSCGENRWEPVSEYTLCWPYAVYLHKESIYVCDTGNNRVVLYEIF